MKLFRKNTLSLLLPRCEWAYISSAVFLLAILVWSQFDHTFRSGLRPDQSLLNSCFVSQKPFQLSEWRYSQRQGKSNSQDNCGQNCVVEDRLPHPPSDSSEFSWSILTCPEKELYDFSGLTQEVFQGLAVEIIRNDHSL